MNFNTKDEDAIRRAKISIKKSPMKAFKIMRNDVIFFATLMGGFCALVTLIICIAIGGLK